MAKSIKEQMKQKIKRLEQLAESNYGREFGWLIELDGVVLGELVDPKFEDMFWTSYQVILKKEKNRMIVFDPTQLFVFRNKVLLETVDSAFTAIGTSIGDERISIRGLYLLPDKLWERKYVERLGKKRRKK